jgi:hypothetical protein
MVDKLVLEEGGLSSTHRANQNTGRSAWTRFVSAEAHPTYFQ